MPFLKLSSGETYDGYWKNDKRNGKGKNTWPCGEIYEGDWIDNKKDGRGFLKLSFKPALPIFKSLVKHYQTLE